MEENCRDGQAINENMAHANCMLANLGYKHSRNTYVTFTDFPLQEWLNERVSMLRNKYIASNVRLSVPSITNVYDTELYQ